MKQPLLKVLSVIVPLILVGCRYDVALPPDSDLAIDTAAVGDWRILESDSSDKEERVQVVAFTDDVYLVNYYTEDASMSLRAYPVEVGGQQYVQIEFLSTSTRVLTGEERNFDLVKYRIDGSKVKLWRLDSDVVDTAIETREGLRNALLDNEGNENLFEFWADFERVPASREN